MSANDELKDTISRLLANVEEQTNVREAFRTAFQGFKGQIVDLQARLDAALNAEDNTDTGELEAINEQLKAIADQLDADVIADKALLNTPSEQEGNQPA